MHCSVITNYFVYSYLFSFFFFNDPATTEIYTLSLHDALPISVAPARSPWGAPPASPDTPGRRSCWGVHRTPSSSRRTSRSEEHTSELQSRFDLVCRLLLEKKNKNNHHYHPHQLDTCDTHPNGL